MCFLLSRPSSSFLFLEECVKGISEEGMPMYKRPELKGNLYFQFEIEFPDPNFFSEATDKLEVCFKCHTVTYFDSDLCCVYMCA